MPLVVHSVKEYVCVMELHADVPEEEIRSSLKYFTGRIYQRPPVRSSVKRVLRKRRIHSIEYLEKKGKHVLLKIRCDPGTYMRKLCHDIGIYLGVGAHMRELRRIRTGPFTEDTAVLLQQLSEAVYLWRHTGEDEHLKKIIFPMEVATCMVPKIIVKDTAVASLAHGANLGIGGIAAYTDDIAKGRNAALFTLKGELIGVGSVRYKPQEIKGEEKDFVKLKRVVISPEKYPVSWRKK
jgi:H/ACA ribonucleoprotein complex subunit 4